MSDPYYHARIRTKGGGIECKFDVSREWLEERVLSPYRTGSPIVISGSTFLPGEIDRIEIIRTDKASDEFSDEIRRSLARKGADEWWSSEQGAVDLTDELISTPLQARKEATTETVPVNPREVWVVHGRDLSLRDQFFTFLSAIGLQPIEFGQAVKRTGKPLPYVGEVLSVAFSAAQAVVVLMTPDDEARLRGPLQRDEDPAHERELTPQARPNVLFEAGMALGTHPDRTVLVEIGSLRPFSDIAGRHVLRLDNSTQRRQELAQRLETAGCPVDLSGTLWHTAGDFTFAAPAERTEKNKRGVPQPYGELLPTPTRADAPDLAEVEIGILRALTGDHAAGYGETAAFIAEAMHLTLQKTIYFIERLEEQRLVVAAHNFLEDSRYFLTQKARTFLVEKGLL